MLNSIANVQPGNAADADLDFEQLYMLQKYWLNFLLQ